MSRAAQQRQDLIARSAAADGDGDGDATAMRSSSTSGHRHDLAVGGDGTAESS